MDSSSQSGGLFRQKIALLIDFDNMILGIEDPGFDIEIVVNALRERGVMVLGRAYGDWYRHARHRRRLMEQGIDLIETPVFGPIIKNSADMHMALDAFEIAHTQAHIDTFCIVSGDSDFLPLIKRLQTRDKNVIVIAGQKFTSDLVRRNCSEYISYENLLAEAMNVHEDVTVIEGAYQLLARAVDTLHERGVEVRSSALKQMMVQLNPMFSERTFGCSQFRNFLDRAQRAGAVRMEGRDTHSGELLASITDEYAEARAQSRAEPREASRDSRYDARPDYRSDSRSYRDSRTESRSENRTESRDRYDRFDRYEPGSSRRESPGQRDERRFTRSEPLRSEPARYEAPRTESRTQPREEAATESRDERILTPATDEATTTEATPEAASEATEGATEARESRRRRGGRGRSKVEARESEVAETAGEADAQDAGVEEAQAAFETGVEAAQDAAQHEDASPQVLEDASAEATSAKLAPEFIDRNSQLGRVPLRRGRLRFSAKKGVTAAAEAPAEVAEPAVLEAQDEVNQASSEADHVQDEANQASSALDEASSEANEARDEADEASSEANQASSAPDEASSEAVEAPDKADEAAEVAVEAAAETVETPAEASEAEAKPKKPRRRAPRKKAAAAEAEAAPAAETEAPAPTPEAEVAAPVVAPTPEVSAPEAEAPAPEAEVEAAPEAEAKPKKRAPRRRAPRKKAGDAEAPEAPPAE